MKELKLYQCEICNTQYKSEKMAIDCEKTHKRIKKVDPLKYRSFNSSKDGIPDTINVTFDNDKVVRYSRG